MNLAAWAVVLMLFGHFLADFAWQPNWMAQRKSTEWSVLASHTMRITAGSVVAFDLIELLHGGGTWFPRGLLFGVVNGVGHFVIDAVTSRATSRLYAAERRHAFFVVIGFDQFLHLSLATVVLAWLMK